MTEPYERITTRTRRGVLSGTVVIVALTWLVYSLDRQAWPGIALPAAVSVLGALNLGFTRWRPRAKVAAIRAVQRTLLNPAIRALLRLRFNPLGVMLVQTTGRRSGRARMTPVGAGIRDGQIWVVAEHGRRAAYVRNLEADPHVRVMLTRGGRQRWYDAVAMVDAADDVLARQRWIAGWNPLRWLNVAIVRCLGAEMVSVRLELVTADRPPSQPVLTVAA